jgi:rhodanese-related sulfurtransferase
VVWRYVRILQMVVFLLIPFQRIYGIDADRRNLDRASGLYSFESHGPYCGVYSIVAAAAALDVDVEISSLWTSEVVSEKTGSSAANLMDGLKSIGLQGTCHAGLSLFDLFDSQNPLILHYRSVTASGGNFDHWVTMLGVNNNGKFLVYDPPFPATDTDLSMLLANWDGFAIEVHRPEKPLFKPFRGTLIMLGLFEVVALGLAVAKQFIPQKLPIGFQLVMTAAALGGSALLIQNLTNIGMKRDSIPVAVVQDRYFGTDFDDIELNELKNLMSRSGVLLIDSRTRSSFAHGSIPGAINLAVNSSLPDREKILSPFPRDAEIVVFCQSDLCGYADEIARFLKFSGFSRIRIYPDGMRGWEARNDKS